jgi:hypothetical protein
MRSASWGRVSGSVISGTILPSRAETRYLEELKDIANYTGVKIIVTARGGLDISIRRATLFYDFFYSAADWASMYDGCWMLAVLEREEGYTVLRLLPSEDARAFKMEPEILAAIAAAGGTYAIKELDEFDAGISVSFTENYTAELSGNGQAYAAHIGGGVNG